ncbi:pyridoxal phosphate-dependent aminotransferase [Streptomyces hygroscopicus subsp. hygroscopicus]|uniref:pyridoxal phosphate-dependent aminotransferase n=1 Tax=Streptomyces hygroscopicus TaxID=1912 RepID=UPI001C65E148|nr:pyridoxal phosphate-dependent aminotransferase [Streptomyces hygroscopicus]MBW8088884.1 pyridoxal phosphate-dependent aminotransferase [Streptomyces hygroscopicus subsp. hygroscopicus]
MSDPGLPSGRFGSINIENAPGEHSDLEKEHGKGVDFSHGDVDAFPPVPDAISAVKKAIADGGDQAYSRYRGHLAIREPLAERLSYFTGVPISPDRELIITPGTQAGLFLALSALVNPGDKVMVVEPDYFANRRIVSYLSGEVVPIPLAYDDPSASASLDLGSVRRAADSGAKVLVFSNPNNPTGALYTSEQLHEIAHIANRYGIFVLTDELYSRLVYPGHAAIHLRACGIDPDRCITLLGPSKSESLSGFRVGTAVGAPPVIDRMEKLLAIVSLRAAGYNQSVLHSWFTEPDGWFDDRIEAHRLIRDDLVNIFTSAPGFRTRPTEAGSYLFPRLPRLSITPDEFVRELRKRTGTVVTPGSEFSPHHGDSIRLNFSQHRAQALNGARSIVELAAQFSA